MHGYFQTALRALDAILSLKLARMGDDPYPTGAPGECFGNPLRGGSPSGWTPP